MMIKTILKKIFLILLIMPLHVFPQFSNEPESIEDMNLTGWRFGINMGIYLANKHTAQFYSGVPKNVNNIAWVLNNKYWYEDVRQELNSNEIIKHPDDVPQDWMGDYNQWRLQYDVAVGDSTSWWIYYPDGLKYDAAISPGFYLKYNFNNTTGVFIQSNYVKLKTSGIFQMVIDSVTYTSQPAYRTGYLRGVEERVNIDIGISKFYTVGKITNLYIESGFHLNSTRVLENDIQIGRKQFTIINRYGNNMYVPNSNMTQYDIYQGGIGFGLFLAGGVKFVFTETIAVDIGTQMYWKKLNLEGYNSFYDDYFFYVRLIFDVFGNSY